MKAQSPQIVQTLSQAPLPMMLEKLGVSIANAQAALDANSINMAQALADTEISVGDSSTNLISLGFAPTFYAFTEATIELKMEFSLAESEEYGGAASFGIGSNGEGTSNVMFGVSVSAHYARKFDMSVEASSSIAARIVSLPAPDTFFELLKSAIDNKE